MKKRARKTTEGHISHYAVGVAAEAYAAGLLAQAGYDISVQYGADRPGYDLVARKGSKTYLVSVKGTQLAGWGLTQGLKKGRTYQSAAKEWLKRNKREDLIFMLIYFETHKPFNFPHVWVARPGEIAKQLRAGCNGRGVTALAVCRSWKSGKGKGTTDSIPESWRFSKKRMNSV